MTIPLTARLKRLLRRVNGLSFPVGGISWSAGQDQREGIRRLIVFLEDRRILHMRNDRDFFAVARSHLVLKSEVGESLSKIREEIVETLKFAEYPGETVETLEAMAACCREVMDSSRLVTPMSRGTNIYETRLGALRLIFGLSVGKLSVAFEVGLGRNMARLVDLAQIHSSGRPNDLD